MEVARVVILVVLTSQIIRRFVPRILTPLGAFVCLFYPLFVSVNRTLDHRLSSSCELGSRGVADCSAYIKVDSRFLASPRIFTNDTKQIRNQQLSV